jgi:hypothetical protein
MLYVFRGLDIGKRPDEINISDEVEIVGLLANERQVLSRDSDNESD